MARKTNPPPPTLDPELRVGPDEAANKIGERITLGEELYARQISTVDQLDSAKGDYRRWNSYNAEMLKRLFTTQKFAEEYSWWGGAVISMYESPAEKLEEYRKDVREKIHRLESVRDRLELIPLAGDIRRTVVSPVARERTNKVFVVHGHDEAARESVARFLERLGLEAVILHEQVTGGRTIVEKLEHYADVGFAVVLLTPDDIGGAKASTPDSLQARARQNVILELGFFVGKLGRKHVCALYKGSLELPSDYLGVGYVALDDGGGWRLHLAKELRGADFSVDMNLAL
ncbi:MAG TPA: nucleotide-binding protein [Longimicrobium sp.]|nr:nucleotide-binding protein [Longimicrobium sp.]